MTLFRLDRSEIMSESTASTWLYTSERVIQVRKPSSIVSSRAFLMMVDIHSNQL